MNIDSRSTRINRRRALELGGAIAGGLMLHPPAAEAASGASLVLDGVTIVDTHTGKLAPNMAVAIDAGKIAQIGAAGSLSGAATIDARGKYLVPGYNDYHAHVLSSSDREGSLTMLLASGVTGWREMASWGSTLADRKSGKLVLPPGVPELLELAGEIITPANAPTPAAAIAEVRRQKDLGADFIKIIDYSPGVFNAVAGECKRQGMRFIGHLSPTVSPRDAAAAGMKSMEHVGTRDSVLLGCSSDEAALRPAFIPIPARPPASGPVPLAIIEKSVANPTLNTPATDYARYQRVVDTFDETRAKELATHFVAAGTWHVPTLIRVRTMAIGDDPAYRNSADLRYVPAQTKAMWESVSEQFDATIPPAARETLKAVYAASARAAKIFKDAGVAMMTGSDVGGGFVVPGVGLHQEFDLLEAAGFTPLDVLQMTTLNGAKFLGREATMGSVAVGRNADLVLLDANPIASIRNLHRIGGVVRAGTHYSTGALAALKQKTADRVASGVAYTATPAPPCC